LRLNVKLKQNSNNEQITVCLSTKDGIILLLLKVYPKLSVRLSVRVSGCSEKDSSVGRRRWRRKRRRRRAWFGSTHTMREIETHRYTDRQVSERLLLQYKVRSLSLSPSLSLSRTDSHAKVSLNVPRWRLRLAGCFSKRAAAKATQKTFKSFCRKKNVEARGRIHQLS
jgi:hypothetical protein